jgi:Plasmid pRiA4b ORF-3-like protein
MSSARAIVRLKVTLKGVEPLVMRPIDVPLKIRLDRLHLILQAALGWTDSHLYLFSAGGAEWGVPDEDFPDDAAPAAGTALRDVIEDTRARTLHYVYDFGDHWDHVIKVERIGEAVPNLLYPMLIAAAGHCPPEDVGGPSGYAELLEVIGDPDHEEHEQMLTWAGGRFDPHAPDIPAIERALEILAKKWAPRPRKAKAPSA